MNINHYTKIDSYIIFFTIIIIINYSYYYNAVYLIAYILKCQNESVIFIIETLTEMA